MQSQINIIFICYLCAEWDFILLFLIEILASRFSLVLLSFERDSIDFNSFFYFLFFFKKETEVWSLTCHSVTLNGCAFFFFSFLFVFLPPKGD